MPGSADVVLRRFRTPTPEQATSPEISQQGDGSSWKDLQNLIKVAVKDKADPTAKALSASMHSMQVQNELLNHENQGLRAVIATKRKHNKKSKPLDLQQRKEFHSNAVFWSPRKVREAMARDDVKQAEEEEEKLQKSKRKELKAAATLYKKIEKGKAKVERERIQVVNKKEREAKAERLAVARAQNSRRKTLQPRKNWSNKQKDLSQEPHEAPAKNLNGVVML